MLSVISCQENFVKKKIKYNQELRLWLDICVGLHNCSYSSSEDYNLTRKELKQKHINIDILVCITSVWTLIRTWTGDTRRHNTGESCPMFPSGSSGPAWTHPGHHIWPKVIHPQVMDYGLFLPLFVLWFMCLLCCVLCLAKIRIIYFKNLTSLYILRMQYKFKINYSFEILQYHTNDSTWSKWLKLSY